VTATVGPSAPGTVTPALESVGGADDEVKRLVHRRLLELDPEGDALLDGALSSRVGEILREVAPLLPAARFERLLRDLVDEIGGFGPLEPLLADPSVSEVMVNGGGAVYVERDGTLEQDAVEVDAATAVRLVERVVAPLGLRLDRSSPMVEARLADGSRLHAVIPPLAPDGPSVTIRRFRVRPVPLEAFDPGPAAAFLRWSVRAGWNLLVAGGTSAGKTTLLNALSAAIDGAERVVTIEETAELRLQLPHVVRLEARPANAEGVGAVDVRDLVRTALRMRPDRVVVGEVRGGEALDMLQALNTGHDGSMSTVHASAPVDALRRLEVLASLAAVALPLPALRAQIHSSVDAVVFVSRGRGARRIESISEVRARGARVETVPLFERDREGVLRERNRPKRHARRSSVDGWEDACER